MGSAIKQKLNRLLACALAICMVVAFIPGAALAAPAVEEGDGTSANAFVGSDGTAQANTEVYMSVTQKFHTAEAFISPGATMGTSESSNAELSAVFEGGTPKTQGSAKYYEASWDWETTADFTPASGTYPSSPVTVTVGSGAEATPEVKLSLGAFFSSLGIAESARPGVYTFTLTVTGENCTAKQEFTFEIVASRAVKDSISSDGITVRGSFDVSAGLAVADLANASTSAQQSLYDKFVIAAGTSMVDAAYQLNVVNETFLNAPELSYEQESVELPAGAAVVAAAQDSPARNLTLLVMVGNKLEQREYAIADGVSASKICYVNVADADDVLTLQQQGGAWTITFQNSDPAQAIGAFALAYAPKPSDPSKPDEPAVSYSVKVIVNGTGSGTYSPDEQIKSYAAGAKPTYVFQAAEGSEVADIQVTGIDGTSPYGGEHTKLANAVTLNGPADRGLQGHVAITVTFNKVLVPVGPGGQVTTHDLEVASNQPGTVAISYTGLSNGEEQPMDALLEATSGGSVPGIIAGSEVRLNISAPVVGATSYVIDKVWVSAREASEQQAKVDANRVNLNGTSMLTISAMQASTTKVWIEYVEGIAPPVIKNTVHGVVSGDVAAGEFSGMTAEVDGSGAKTGRYRVEVAENYSQDVQVNAAADHVVASVVLYKGVGPDDLAAATAQTLYQWEAGDEYLNKFAYRIPAVACDYTVVATFQERSDTPVVPEAHKSLYRASAGAYGSITPASAEVAQGAAAAVFTITPQTGYRIASISLYNETAQRDESSKLPSLDSLNADGDSIELGYLGDASYVLSATFAKKLVDPDKAYRLTARAVVIDDAGNVVSGNGGSISPTSTTVTAGSRQVFTMVPAAGYNLARVTANGQEVAVSKHEDGYFYFAAEDVQSNLMITAYYQKASEGSDGDGDTIAGLPVSVQVRAVGPGSVQPAGLVDVARGIDLPIYAAPNADCRLRSLTVDGLDVTPMGTGTVEYVLKTAAYSAGQRVSVVATFEDAAGVVTPPAEGDDVSVDVNVTVKASTVNAAGQNVFGDAVGGTVSPTHATVAWGGSQRFIIKPKDGSYVVRDSVKAQDALTGAEVPVEFGSIALDAGEGSAADQNAFTAQMGSEVQAGYSWVRVSGIQGDLVLTVEFSGCDETTGRYVYGKAADTIVDTTPDVSGDVDVEYPDNDPDAVVGEDKDIIVKPGSEGETIKKIEIYDHTLEFVDKDGDGKIDQIIIDGTDVRDIVPPGDPDEIQKVIDEFNRVIDKELGYDKQPGYDPEHPNEYVKPGKDENGELDGSYELNLPTVDANGDKVDPGVKVEASGDGGVLYQHTVSFKVAAEGGSRGGYLTIARNSLADNLGSVESVMMNHGGMLLVSAYPADEGDQVRFTVDNPDNLAEDTGRNLQMTVPLTREALVAPKAYVVTGPGTVTATFYKTSGGDEPGGDQPGGDQPGGDQPGGDQPGSNPGGNEPGGVLGPADVEAGRAYAVTVLVDDSKTQHGTISPSGTQYFAIGENAEYNLIPDEGYRVASVAVDGVSQPWTSNKYTFVYDAEAEAQAQQAEGLSLVEKAYADPVIGGSHHTISAEFVLDSAGMVTGGNRALKTVQSLAQTGDLTAPGVLALSAVAFGAIGAAFLANSRRRRDAVAAGEADTMSE